MSACLCERFHRYCQRTHILLQQLHSTTPSQPIFSTTSLHLSYLFTISHLQRLNVMMFVALFGWCVDLFGVVIPPSIHPPAGKKPPPNTMEASFELCLRSADNIHRSKKWLPFIHQLHRYFDNLCRSVM
jgi:hypothetical protein